MTIALTPDRVAAVYECLRSFEPFCRWKLPDADEVEFSITRHQDRYGQYWNKNTKPSCTHGIDVSQLNVGHFNTLAWVVAHEMIHLRQVLVKTASDSVMHNADFRRTAHQVCRIHGWDPREFI